MMPEFGSYAQAHKKDTEARDARFKFIDEELANGISVDAIADSVGVKRDSIARQASRHGRPDIASKFKTR